MNAVSVRYDEPEYPGRIDYECRNVIRDLIRAYGADAARELVDGIFTDESERNARRATRS